MKKILALVLVLSMFAALAACTQVTRISVENPAEIKLEKAGGGVAVTLTENKTVSRITDVICQIPLQVAEATEDAWTYRITWLDATVRPSPPSPWRAPRSAGREIATTWVSAWTCLWSPTCWKPSPG